MERKILTDQKWKHALNSLSFALKYSSTQGDELRKGLMFTIEVTGSVDPLKGELHWSICNFSVVVEDHLEFQALPRHTGLFLLYILVSLFSSFKFFFIKTLNTTSSIHVLLFLFFCCYFVTFYPKYPTAIHKLMS